MPERVDCGITQVDNLLAKKWDELTDEQQSDVSRRIEESLRRIKAVGHTAVDMGVATEAQAKAQQHFAFMLRTASNVSISPHSQRNLGYYLSKFFALEYNALGLGNTFTSAGGVNHTLQALRRRGEGTLHELLNRIHFIDDSIEADKVFEGIRKAHGIARTEWDKLKLDAYEIGFLPYAQKDFGIVGPNGIEYMRGLQQRFHDDLVRLGITQPEAERMAQAVTKVNDNYRATLEMLHEFGVRVNDASDIINYLPRNFSQETLRRIGWAKKKDSFEVFDIGGKSDDINITTVFTRSRQANNLVVEDSILLDALVTAVNPLIYDVLGVEGIDDLIGNSGALTRAFTEVIDKIQPDLFDALVDTGIVSKLPMTGGELFEYMKMRYELPFVELNEWQAVDFTSIAALYKQQAERLVGRSMMSHFTVKAAVEGGWGITDMERMSNPELYSKYMQLVSPNRNRQDTVFSAAEAQRLGIDVFGNANVYVHPVVGEMFRAQIDVMSDPNQLAIVDRIANDLATTFSQMALMTSGFVFRQIYAPIFQTWAGGGRIDTYGSTLTSALGKIADLKNRGLSLDTFEEAFDDTRRIYRVDGELVTERELWNKFRTDGEVSELMPFMGENVASLNYKPTAPDVFDIPGTSALAGLQRQRRYMWDVMQTHQINGGQKIQELYKTMNTGWRRFSDQTFHFFGASNMLVDNIGRFSLLKDLTNTTRFNRAVRAAQGNFARQLDYEEAVRRVNQYFFRYDNRGEFDDWLRHVRPFWMFQSRNMHSVFRMMVREPGRFMAYQRLFAALNEPEQEKEDIPYGAVPDWVTETAPSIFWVRRDENGTPLEYMVFPRAQLDNIAAGTEDITSSMDSVLNYFGIWPNARTKTISDRYRDLPWDKTNISRGLRAWAADGYGHLQVAYALMTGEDARTGAQLRSDDTGIRSDNLWGVEISPMNKYLLESLFPLVRSINRSNPGGVFGTPPRFEGTEMVDEGRPSWAGVDRRPNSADFRTWWQRTASVAGFNTYNFDVLDQLGYRQTEISFTIREGYRSLGAKRRQIMELDPSDSQRIQVEIEKLRAMEALQAALVLDYVAITNWASERGLEYPAAIRHMRRNNTTAQQLGSLTDEEANELLRRVYGNNLLGGTTVPEYKD